MAHVNGVRVVAIVGGTEKKAKLEQEFGFDSVIDYKAAATSEELVKVIKGKCPSGIHGYFDNVGGTISTAVDACLNNNARVYVAGAISQYPSGASVAIQKERQEMYKNKQVTAITCMELDYINKIPEARNELIEMIKNGQIKAVEWITSGIENCAIAFEEMYKGKNYGKSIVKVL